MNDLREKIAKCDAEMITLEDEINRYINGEKEKQMKAMKNEQRKDELLL